MWEDAPAPGLADRFPVHRADIRTAALPASFDLVLLFQNSYYFAEDERLVPRESFYAVLAER
jgi:hypothetical protein